MQINGIGNNQIGNSYQNPNRMPNSTTGKKEDDVSKRLEELGVKVELSFQQAGMQEQETVREAVETEKPQESFSVIGWIKKIWDAGIAWLKSIWNDEPLQENDGETYASQEIADSETDSMQEELVGANTDLADAEMFDADVELVAESPLDEGRDYASMHVKQAGKEKVDMPDANLVVPPDKFRTAGTPLHTSGMQDSYNRYGQHSKLGVEPSNNVQVRK